MSVDITRLLYLADRAAEIWRNNPLITRVVQLPNYMEGDDIHRIPDPTELIFKVKDVNVLLLVPLYASMTLYYAGEPVKHYSIMPRYVVKPTGHSVYIVCFDTTLDISTSVVYTVTHNMIEAVHLQQWLEYTLGRCSYVRVQHV